MLSNYALNPLGMLQQLQSTPITYDHEYVASRYDTYGDLNALMSNLRLGFVCGAMGGTPRSSCDVGYGNGTFLKACEPIVSDCYGFDISGYPLPDGASFLADWRTKPVDVLTFFDVLEHFEDPFVLRGAQAQCLVISVPFCRYRGIRATEGEDAADAWFSSWKHRRPNEHLWHFDADALMQFARSVGYRLLALSTHEDQIRQSDDGYPNILTGAFVKDDSAE